MKLWKILLPLTLCLVLAVLFLPTTANAAYSGTCGTNLTWTLDDAGTLTISGTGAMYDYDWGDAPWYSRRSSVKKVMIADGVTTIGDSAFYDCSSLTSVTIPDSVTTIGRYAFYDCTSLTSVTIPDSVTTIGSFAFSYCTSLTGVTIPDSVTTIGASAFFVCYRLTSVTIGNSVTTIGDYAFYDCDSLTGVTIPDSVTTIGNYAFASCTSLTDVYYGGTQAQWDAISIGSYNEDLQSATIHFVTQGDVDGNWKLDTDDAVYLLLHVMFGDRYYPVAEDLELDFDSNGQVDTDDALYLLLHVMFGAEDYPLAA